LEILHRLVASAENTKNQEKKRTELMEKMEKAKDLEKGVRDSLPKLELKLQVALNEVERQRNAGELQKGQENAYTDLVAELKENKAVLIKGLRQTHDKVLQLEAMKHDLDNDINGKKALLKKYKIGKEPGDQYKSVKEIDREKKKAKEQMNKLTEQRVR